MPGARQRIPGATACTPVLPARPDDSKLGRGRRLQLWLALVVFWTVLPFVLIYVLDLVWDDTFVFPQASVATFVVLYWWGWIPLSVLVVRLGRRLPLFGPHALWNLALHLVACAGIAVLYSCWVAGVAAVLPIEGAAKQILGSAFRIFEGFGALAQMLYWFVLLGSTTVTRVRMGRRGKSHPRSGELHEYGLDQAR